MSFCLDYRIWILTVGQSQFWIFPHWIDPILDQECFETRIHFCFNSESGVWIMLLELGYPFCMRCVRTELLSLSIISNYVNVQCPLCLNQAMNPDSADLPQSRILFMNSFDDLLNYVLLFIWAVHARFSFLNY